jgi:hypothetical protein
MAAADSSSAADAIGAALGHLELQVGQLGEHVATRHGRVAVEERGGPALVCSRLDHQARGPGGHRRELVGRCGLDNAPV